MSYIIAGTHGRALAVDPAELADRVREAWPTARVRQAEPRSEYAWEWEVPGIGGAVEGMVDRPGDSVTLGGHMEDCARFGLWLVALLRPPAPLLFLDFGGEGALELSEATTLADFNAAFPDFV